MSQPVTWERRHEAFKALWEKLEEVRSAVDDKGTPVTVTTTDANDKEVRSPSAGKKTRVKAFFVWNVAGADRTITGIRFGSGSYHFQAKLADKTGYAMNLLGTVWEGAADEKLHIKADGASVSITVFYEEA